MSKPEKKLKAVKCHYSHEIRKDVDLSALQSLKLEKAWPFIRSEIEHEIGNDSLVCVPFVEETSVYSFTSIFDKTGGRFKPLGSLIDLADDVKSDSMYLDWLRNKNFDDEEFKFPHESVKITLQDEEKSNKVRVIMINFFRHRFPKNRSPMKYIRLKNNKELNSLQSVYMITDVLMAKTIEFRISTGFSSRIFHVGNPTPLLFVIEQFHVGDSGKFLSRVPVTITGKEWCKVDPRDQLYSPEFGAPTVVQEASPVADDTITVEEEASPVVEEAPPVVEEAPPVVEDAQPIMEDAPPVAEDVPVEDEPAEAE